MEICFVCTGNASRSPMAEVIAKHQLKKLGLKWIAFSCGTKAIEGEPVSRRAEIVCSEIGLSLSGMKRRKLNNDMVNSKTIFVVMQPEHLIELKQLYGIEEDRILLIGNGIPDPRDCDLDVYRSCRDKLITEIDRLLCNLIKKEVGILGKGRRG